MFEYELVLVCELGIFGLIDMNCNDYQLGWDMDQFLNNVLEMVLVYYEVLCVGGFIIGGINFDVKLCCQLLDVEDLIFGYVGVMDCCVVGFKVVVVMFEDGKLEQVCDDCYVGWNSVEV